MPFLEVACSRLVETTLDSGSCLACHVRFYVITYEGGSGLQHFLLGLIIAGVLLACMFPVWPMWAKASRRLRPNLEVARVLVHVLAAASLARRWVCGT